MLSEQAESCLLKRRGVKMKSPEHIAWMYSRCGKLQDDAPFVHKNVYLCGIKP